MTVHEKSSTSMKIHEVKMQHFFSNGYPCPFKMWRFNLMVVHGNPWISINSHQWPFRLGYTMLCQTDLQLE